MIMTRNKQENKHTSTNYSNEFWGMPLKDIYKQLATSTQGLTEQQVAEQLQKFGKNMLQDTYRRTMLQVLISQFNNPFIFLLLGATIISLFMSDVIEAAVILVIILINGCVGFLQEYKAEHALIMLQKYILSTTHVIRNGRLMEVDSRLLVPGDIVNLNLGDVVAADMRLIFSKNLTMNEASLTGESMPVEKEGRDVLLEEISIHNMPHIVFTGTWVSSGLGQGVVIATGMQTYWGSIAHTLNVAKSVSEFQQQIKKFGLFIMKIAVCMTLFVLVVNALWGKPILESAMFAIAIAIGITPELLPLIATLTLSQGALRMAKKKVIVKKLSSIEILGNMDILCCDKTGTLTEGVLVLQHYVDSKGQENDALLDYGIVCSSIEVNQVKEKYANPIDHAILEFAVAHNRIKNLDSYAALDKDEFDFTRRRMSCIIQHNKQKFLVVKGAPDSIIPLCSADGNNDSPLNDEQRNALLAKVEKYEQEGYRVIALALKETSTAQAREADEKDLVLLGFFLFLDAPKKTVKESLAQLSRLGVELKVISGDSPVVTNKICSEVGVVVHDNKIITGNDLELAPDQVAMYAKKYNVFARITPNQKVALLESLKEEHVVGFLGDGINDAPALSVANVGISVNSAVDIAKNVADIVLIKKSLHVLVEGVIEGRGSFVNVTKYILTTLGCTFGNMVSLTISSMFLPFIPMLPVQVLLTNFMSDISCMAIASDNVDQDFLIKPEKWDLSFINHFMIVFGLIGSCADLVLLGVLYYWWHPAYEVFRSAWFIENCLTAIFTIFAVRTHKFFWQSKPSKSLLVTSLIVSIVVCVLPYTFIGQKYFYLVPLSTSLILFIGSILIAYCIVLEVVKRIFYKKFNNVK